MNAILSTEEKTFLDDAPEAAIAAIVLNPDQTKIELGKVTDEGVTNYTFEGERANAVRNYYQMLIDHGVMKDPRA